MDFSQLQKLTSKDKIRELLLKGVVYGGGVWQSLDFQNKENLISQIAEVKFDEESEKILLKFPVLVSVDTQKPIYIKLNYRRTIFKVPVGQFLVSGKSVICIFPNEVHAVGERKGGDRYQLLPSAGLSLSIKRAERTVHEMTFEMEVRIVDVSEKGFGIIISQQNRGYLRENDFFWLKAVNQKELRTPILGTVCYVSSNYKHPGRGQVRLGLSLSLSLDSETLEELKKESIVVLAA